MDQDLESDTKDMGSRLTNVMDRYELDSNPLLHSATSEIGDQTGISLRAPSFGDSALSKQAGDYLSVSALHYSTDAWNKLLLNDNANAITTATGRYAVAISYGFALAGQVGIIPPVYGWGPYLGGSLTAGMTSTGERFVQLQGSFGGGIGTFRSYGATESNTFNGKLNKGWSSDNRIEINAGLVRSGSFSINLEKEVTVTASPLLAPRLSWGSTLGLAAAGVHSETITFINPDIMLKQSWDEFTTSAGRQIYEIEIQLYEWSRLMEL
jgi:hypothetical protein